MKTILYLTRNLIRSEATIALMERLYLLPAEDYHSELLLIHPIGELLRKLPSKTALITHPHPSSLIKKALYDSKHTSIKKSTSFPADKTYDELAVFGTISDKETLGLSERIRAREKTLYLFSDEKPLPAAPPSPAFFSFQQIFASTPAVKAALLRYCPSLGGRVHVLPDTVEINRVKRLSLSRPSYGDTGFEGLRILTAGTPSLVANEILALQTAFVLKKRGFYFRMYFMNGGPYVKALIRIMGLQNRVFCLEPTPNPYPYIFDCDLFLATEHLKERSLPFSYHHPPLCASCPKADDPLLEAALVLGAPIVAINTPLLHSRLAWEDDALLVEDDPNILADAVSYMTEDI